MFVMQLCMIPSSFDLGSSLLLIVKVVPRFNKALLSVQETSGSVYIIGLCTLWRIVITKNPTSRNF